MISIFTTLCLHLDSDMHLGQDNPPLAEQGPKSKITEQKLAWLKVDAPRLVLPTFGRASGWKIKSAENKRT